MVIQVTNKAICWTSITGFALTQLPGVLARMYNIVQNGNLGTLPSPLKWALGLRKHLGLVSLWFLGLHILMSTILFNPAYYGKFYIDPTAPTSKMNVIGETSFFFATIGTMLYAILGVASLPAVGTNMSSRQWHVSIFLIAALHRFWCGWKDYDMILTCFFSTSSLCLYSSFMDQLLGAR